MWIKNNLPKVKASFAILLFALAFFVINIQSIQAGIVNTTVGDVPATIAEVKTTLGQKILKVLKTFGSKLINTTLRNTLNRIAIDAAQWVATGGEGQKPQFVTEGFPEYWKNIGDAAAGDFIDEVGKNWQIDLCQPPDPNVRANISLGLVQSQRPEAPNCSLSNLATNYSTAFEKYKAMQGSDYLKGVQVSFEPGGGELGGAFELFGRTANTSDIAKKDSEAGLTITQGWLDVRGVDGKLRGTPGAAQENLTQIQKTKADSLLVQTGDVFVDAANIFLNQLGYEAMQRGLRELTRLTQKNDGSASSPSSNPEDIGIQYGEKVIGEKLASFIKPRFNVRSDYDILSSLAICPDINNPGPNNCVIDDKFSQSISEKLTVGEALAKGYLHGDWLVSSDNKSESTYTLRSAIILRKFRVLPVGWEQAISAATANNYKVTFQDLVSCFDGNGPFSADFNKNNQAWCRGLVDPNWVLKIPLGFCSKEGVGSQILSSFVSKDEKGLSNIAISRVGDYCADEQSCIKEKSDGSCEVYGYCNEEKRTWNFSLDNNCEPTYNTCQTFTSATNKKTTSYLENTLDFSTCDANNSGCKQYVYGGVYSTTTNQVSWDKRYSIFLNNKAPNCNVTAEGCTNLLRGKPGWADVNFVMDSDFNLNNVGDTSTSTNWHWPIRNGLATIISGKSLSIVGTNGAAVYSNNTNSILPKNLTVIPGWSYTLSADVKIDLGDKIVMSFGDSQTVELSEKEVWTKLSIIVSSSGQGTNNLDLAITGSGAQVSFSVRNLKLTPNDFASSYSSYAAFPIYEKLLPAYLESVCYNSVTGTGDYRLKVNAPTICNNYARKCNREEVGCELYTSIKDNFSVPAKANSADYCDAQCVGYDTYLAKSSYFYGTSADNLIPVNTKICSAESAGCASFTNLDAVGAGGESLEYYSKIRQCIKPDTASCGDFYSWDNSQLKAMSLKKDAGGNPFIVDPVSDALCTKDIYNLPTTDPAYNADCREFYSKSGQITYHLFSNTVSCSDNCNVYRINEKNTDPSLTASSCVGNDKNWDIAQSVCYVCKNGGVWNTGQNSCLYRTVPGDGATCAAEEVGCREYNGNNGNNLRVVANYNFELNVSGFSGYSGAVVSQSTQSTAKNGHSLAYSYDGSYMEEQGTSTSQIEKSNNIFSYVLESIIRVAKAYTNPNNSHGAQVDVSTFAKKNSAYVIKFMARATNNVTTNFYFENSDGDSSSFSVDDNNPQGNIIIKGGSQWNLYEINLRDLDHDIKEEKLKINADGSFFIDNLVVSEISDRYYLIKGSSQIPDICYYDMSDNYQGPSYNLGCAQYKDREGIINNLHRFSELCQDSAVGCEQMIQTYDSSDYYGYTLNLNNEDQSVSCVTGTPGCLEVKGHKAIYAVFNPAKQCNKADQGCTRFGYSKTSGATTNWADAYKKNLPDTYKSETASPICQSAEVGCDVWTNREGASSYFKDPGLNTCIFRNNLWYKTPVQRCDLDDDGKINDTEKDGAVCLTNLDCGILKNTKCVTDNNDYLCPVSYLKTIGLGGPTGTAVPDGVVGLCGAESSGCSEYIDPVSKFVNNIIYNPAAEDLDKNGSSDKWDATSTPATGYYTQRVSVKPNKLYILQVSGPNVLKVVLDRFSTSINGSGGTARILGATSTDIDLLSSATNELSEPFTVITSTSSIIFHTGRNTYVNVYRFGTTTPLTTDKVSVSLKEAIINYEVNTNLDTKTCNGVVNTDGGCVLFNARTQVGRNGLKRLIFNANDTVEGSAPAACLGLNCSANQVIKVSPDRICSRWLSCQTYVEDSVTKEKTCYAMGECDQLNDKNECGNFLSVDNTVRNIQNTQNKNATGYSLLNNYYLGAMKEVGQNTDAHFDFENSSVNLSCRRNVDIASGSELEAEKNKSCDWDKTISDSLVLEPDNSPTNYPAHGKGYLKALNYYQISPQSNNSAITIYTNQDYYINYLVNTKGSSANAKLVITNNNDASPQTYVRFIDDAPNGWERKVRPFRIVTSNGQKTQIKIKIYLSSNTDNTNNGYVYFDDINIEPALQTGTDSYVSKDCRLYPSDDSLSCLSANNNVVKDGLYGYCLQYDPLNPSVCLMWYPIDKISPITRNNQSNLGYSGKFPLYYCSEANGDFSPVEKRIIVKHGAWRSDHAGSCNNGNGEESCAVISMECNGDYNYMKVLECDTNNSSNTGDWVREFCVPNPDNLLVKKAATVAGSNYCSKQTSIYYPAGNKSFVVVEGWGRTNTQEWWGFNGFQNWPVSKCEIDGDCTTLNEAINANPSVRIYDWKIPPVVEDDLKLAFGQDAELNYRITCNKFTQLVDGEGGNMAWTGRVSRSSIFPTSTPSFFYDIPGNFSYATGVKSIILYGRNREDVPFGSAVFPNNYDLVNSERIFLRDQYAEKNKETVLAGRPYGCSSTGGVINPGCSNIGQCSLNPNIFCIFLPNATSQEAKDFNKKSCSASGNGECAPLWSGVPTSPDNNNIFNKIFIKKYSDYTLASYASGGYYPDTNSLALPQPTTIECTGKVRSTDPTSGAIKSFCPIFPVISNAAVKLGGAIIQPVGGKIVVTKGNLYELEFNTLVDLEQQPLKQIIIDWGDGNLQVLSNLDNKPKAGVPHKVYHYYPVDAVGYSVKIKIIDNWETWACVGTNANGWQSISCPNL